MTEKKGVSINLKDYEYLTILGEGIVDYMQDPLARFASSAGNRMESIAASRS